MRRLLFVLLFCAPLFGQSVGGRIAATNQTIPGNLTVGGITTLTKLNTAAYIFVDQVAGADACAKMATCEAALVAQGGGTCDARAFRGSQSCAQMVFSTNQVRHLFADVNLTLTGNPGLLWSASGSTLEGASLYSTQLITNSATADLIKLTSAAAQNRLSDFLLQSSVTRSAGAGLRVQGGNNTIERIQFYPIWDGIVLDTITTGDNNIFDKIYYGVSAGGGNAAHHCAILNGGVASSQVASNTFRSMTILSSSASSFTDAAICIQDGSDSITIADSQIVANVGFTDSVMLHLEQVNGGNAPSNIKISNVTFEGGLTKNAVVIDSADGIDFYNTTAQSSLRGILVNAGNRVHWNGGLLYNNQNEGARVVAATDFTLVGARLQNNSQAANNSFDDIFLTAGSAAISSFVISDNNFTRRGAPANLSKWNIELPSGNTDNYTITGNVTPATAFATGAITDGGTGLNKFVCNGTNGCSSVVAAPDGTATAPGQTFASHRTIGWYLDSNLSMQLGFNGAGPLLNGTQIGLGTGMELCWASGADPNNTACDTSLSRDAAGVTAFGTGAVGSVAGSIKATKEQLVEAAAPSGVASQSVIFADSGDHMLKYNPNNAGKQHVPQVYILTAQYTNATTSFTTIGTPNIAFPVNANENYTATCHLYYQAAATGGLNIEFTGPASPTSVTYGLDDPSSATTFNSAVATAFATSLGQVVGTAATNFDAIVSLGLVNGANAGTVTLLGKSSAAVASGLIIQPGSYCQVQ